MSLQGIASGVTTQGVFTPENLIAGEFPRIMRIETITGGQALPQGGSAGSNQSDRCLCAQHHHSNRWFGSTSGDSRATDRCHIEC